MEFAFKMAVIIAQFPIGGDQMHPDHPDATPVAASQHWWDGGLGTLLFGIAFLAFLSSPIWILDIYQDLQRRIEEKTAEMDAKRAAERDAGEKSKAWRDPFGEKGKDADEKPKDWRDSFK
jgi:hypothetical protein